MVNPLEIMPILAMAFAIACIPILSDGPFKGRQSEQESRRKTRIHLPHPRR
jgi:hypothetical protein